MKVCVCQTAPRLLGLQDNLAEAMGLIKEGREKGADLVVFPELALTRLLCGRELPPGRPEA